MSPYNEDNTLDSSGYQGYHRSHHQSQNLYIAKMFANGSLPYSDFFATGGFFYYLLVSLAFRLGSTLWLIPIQFLTY